MELKTCVCTFFPFVSVDHWPFYSILCYAVIGQLHYRKGKSSFKKSGTNRQKTDTKKAVYIYVTKNVAGTIKAIMNIVKVLPAIR